MFQSDTNFIKFPHILSMLFIPTLHYDMLISVMYIYICISLTPLIRSDTLAAAPLVVHVRTAPTVKGGIGTGQSWPVCCLSAQAAQCVEAKKRSAAWLSFTTQDLTIETLPSLTETWDILKFMIYIHWNLGFSNKDARFTLNCRILMTQNWIEWRIGTLALTKRNPGKLGCFSNPPIHRTTLPRVWGDFCWLPWDVTWN